MSENTRYQHRGAAHKVEFPLNQLYDSVEFNLANGQSDYDLDAGQAAAFANLSIWTSVFIRTNKDISIKLNSASNPVISIREYESPFHLRTEIEVSNIFFTNASGQSAAIKLLGFHRAKGHD